MKPKFLSEDFYHQSTKKIARELLGKQLTRIWRGQKISGLIVETEAYLGLTDKAAHSYGGRITDRTKTFYLAGGHSYVYLIYGIHSCFNVICGDKDRPEAVLIRALEPTAGLNLMHKFRSSEQLTNGPGRLCQAMQISRKHNALPLNASPLYIEDVGIKLAKSKIKTGPRIGIDYSEEAKHWPLRFWIADNVHVSKK